MLSRLRRRLRLMRYYAADRKRSAWAQRLDVVLVATLLLALPMTWVADHAFVKSEPGESVEGRIAEDSVRGTIAWTVTPRDALDRWPENTLPLAEFTLSDQVEQRGFPFVTVEAWSLMTLEVKPLATARASAAEMQADDRIRDAVLFGLQEEARFDVIDAWTGSVERRERSWLTVFANAMCWWFAMFVAGAVLLAAGWYASARFRFSRTARQRHRERTGFCPHCNYDLRGNPWAEKCPECGELV